MNNLYLLLASEPVEVESAKNFIDLIFSSNILNFILVVIFLVWVSKKTKVFSAISETQNLIKRGITNSDEEKNKAESQFQANKKKVKKVNDEVRLIIREANGIASSLADRILGEAEIQSKEMDQRTEKVINVVDKAASHEVARDISRAAFIIAEEHIKQAMDAKLHKKYIDEFINDLETLKV